MWRVPQVIINPPFGPCTEQDEPGGLDHANTHGPARLRHTGAKRLMSVRTRISTRTKPTPFRPLDIKLKPSKPGIRISRNMEQPPLDGYIPAPPGAATPSRTRPLPVI